MSPCHTIRFSRLQRSQTFAANARPMDGQRTARKAAYDLDARRREINARGELARWIGPDTIFASYNDKSYDAPLLRARYRLARMADATARLEHVDPLYPAR